MPPTQDPNQKPDTDLGPVVNEGGRVGNDALQGTRPVDESNPNRTAASVMADDKAESDTRAAEEGGDDQPREQGLDTDEGRENIRRSAIERVNNMAKNDPSIAALSPQDREKIVDDALRDAGKAKATRAITAAVADTVSGPERVGDYFTRNRTVETPLASKDQGPDGPGSHDAAASLAPNDAALNAPIDPSRLPIQSRPPGGLRRHVRRQLEMAKRTA